jgi:hypothetical protein
VLPLSIAAIALFGLLAMGLSLEPRSSSGRRWA